MTDSYTYDSFGSGTSLSGTIINPFRYTGRELDSETGLYYYRARYYAPTERRFLSEDPIRFSGGMNFYRYVSNNPTNLVDPSIRLAWLTFTFGVTVVREMHGDMPQ